jgi:prepilin-type N-terminal cleavage/methylation domain-containing protein
MLTGKTMRRRAGFTLIELLISMVLMGLVSAAIVKLLLRQQRFYNSATDLIQTRQQIRQAAGMLPSDLRGISSVGADIYVMSDSAIEFRSVFGTSVVCANNAGKLSTVPRVLARNSQMTSWTRLPALGDSVLVYDNGATTALADDNWRGFQLSTTAPVAVTSNLATGCPTTSGLTQAGDVSAANPSYQLTFATAAPATIVVGAGMRFFRRVHYRIYKDTDNQWYIGFFDCIAGRVPVCNPTQAIAGPFQAYAVNGTSGMQFAYYDSLGAVTANPLQVARISLVVRGQAAALMNLSGAGGTVFRDSLRIEVGLRNRR